MAVTPGGMLCPSVKGLWLLFGRVIAPPASYSSGEVDVGLCPALRWSSWGAAQPLRWGC